MHRSTPVALWQQVFEQLEHHARVKRDRTPLDALNRILRKHYAASRVAPETWSIEARRLDPSEVAKLSRVPVSAPPHDSTAPIVVVCVGERWCVVDGNKRVNAWLKQPTESLDAIVIAPRVTR